VRTLFVLLFAGCMAHEPARSMGPYGPRPLPEEMQQGRVECRAQCASLNRDFGEYNYDGACICAPERLKPEHQG